MRKLLTLLLLAATGLLHGQITSSSTTAAATVGDNACSLAYPTPGVVIGQCGKNGAAELVFSIGLDNGADRSWYYVVDGNAINIGVSMVNGSVSWYVGLQPNGSPKPTERANGVFSFVGMLQSDGSCSAALPPPGFGSMAQPVWQACVGAL